MSTQTRFAVMKSPLGRVLIAGSLTGLSHINFLDGDDPLSPNPAWQEDAPFLAEAIAQLKAYFAGQRTRFDLHLALGGTPFQRQVWQAVAAVPYGSTAAYANLACQLGRPQAARAVGAANGANPLPIVIPCHRVVGSDGSLTGYAGGLQLKQWLLQHERRTLGHHLQDAAGRAFQMALV